MGRHIRSLFLASLMFLVAALTIACSGSVRGVENDRSAITSASEPSVAEASGTSADASRVEVTAGEVSVKALNLFKKGDSKGFRTELASIFQDTAVTEIYTSLNATYELESEAVFSDAVITIAAPTGEAVDFTRLRILKLDANDMYPSGFVWSDCTVLRDRKHYPGVGDEFFPDPTKRSVSCYFDRTSGVGQRTYFTLVSTNGTARTAAVSKIQMVLEKAESLEGGDGIRYVLTVKNVGPKDVAEVNFHSTFAMGAVLDDVRPSIGRCQPARYGNSESSVACYLGGMKTGEQTQVEFTAKAGREKPALDKNFNRRWVIRGFSRQGANDEVVPGAVFRFEPLAK
jgi:hypothetical protein